MLAVYLDHTRFTPLPLCELPADANELKKYLLDKVANAKFTWADLYTMEGTAIGEGKLSPTSLGYAVLSCSPEEAARWKPIKVVLRRTDRTGRVMWRHPASTIAELQAELAKFTGVPVIYQELLHGGRHVTDPNCTLE